MTSSAHSLYLSIILFLSVLILYLFVSRDNRSSSSPSRYSRRSHYRDATSSEISLLDGRGFLSSSRSSFTVSFYNGNTNIAITDVAIGIIDPSFEPFHHTYSQTTFIKPLSVSDVTFTILPPSTNFHWSILSARCRSFSRSINSSLPTVSPRSSSSSGSSPVDPYLDSEDIFPR